MKKVYIILLLILTIVSCSKDNENIDLSTKNLTIFFVNDQHGQLENFSKIKHIIDKERQEVSVIVACGGDIFSGNPVVDNYDDKGYPIIDIMNKVGFDISVIGNHEFDYGEAALKDRMEQAEFDWVCANIDMGNTGIPEPWEYRTLTRDGLRITFLGLIETNGKPTATIPSTHPLKVQNFIFQRPENVVSQYANIKEQENSDLYIALSHLGHTGYDGALGDFQLAQQYPYFDLIIGGHSNELLATEINNIPIFQAGNYLEYLGKVELFVNNKKVESYKSELINLEAYTEHDDALKTIIDDYNSSMADVFDEVIGYSHLYHEKSQVGCFYTDALRHRLDVDVTFQNRGGVRSHLDQGDITVREIYEIDPFNNGTLIYEMSVAGIKSFLAGASSGFYYSGIQIELAGSNILIKDLSGNLIPDNTVLSVGINDYIPAVYNNYFPENGVMQPYTTAEAIIYYLVNINDQVNYPNCQNYFRY